MKTLHEKEHKSKQTQQMIPEEGIRRARSINRVKVFKRETERIKEKSTNTDGRYKRYSVRVTGISEEENKNKESIKENVPESKEG